MINRYLKLLFLMCLLLLTISPLAQAETPKEQLNKLMHLHKGKVIFLDFWASWCVPCRKSFPWLNTAQRKFKKQGFVVISVNLDREKSFAETFLQSTPAEFAIIYDYQSSLAKEFKLKGMPSSFLFDRKGNKIGIHVGFNTEKQQQFEQEIIKALE
jgi:thiol-disulfide isomerase/thioredoxin